MTTMYEVIILITGTPADEMQASFLYMISCIVSVIMIMYFLYLFKLIGGFIRTK